jgi:hypothetical protein
MRTVSTTGCWLGTGAIMIGDSLHEFPRTPFWRSSQDPEILWKSAGSESQQLATFPRPVCDDVGR